MPFCLCGSFCTFGLIVADWFFFLPFFCQNVLFVSSLLPLPPFVFSSYLSEQDPADEMWRMLEIRKRDAGILGMDHAARRLFSCLNLKAERRSDSVKTRLLSAGVLTCDVVSRENFTVYSRHISFNTCTNTCKCWRKTWINSACLAWTIFPAYKFMLLKVQKV